MKLLRFELASAPGYVRSGIFHGGKVYETDGDRAIGVHDWPDVVPFLPTGQPPSYRMFRTPTQESWLLDEDFRPAHFYLNPASLIAPSRTLPGPLLGGALGYEPQFCAVISGPGKGVEVTEAESLILGLTVANTFVARDFDASERREGGFVGRSRDVGTALGPFLTTPEELDDAVVDESRGRRYKLEAVIRVNGEEVARQNLADLPYTMGELVSFASEFVGLLPGDLIGIGPIALENCRKLDLETGDEVQVQVERLGALATRIA